MTAEIQIVQGFRGSITYKLEDDFINLANAVVKFNYNNRTETDRHSITCKIGSSQGEVIIPFKQIDTINHGKYYGEFVITTLHGTSIFPINHLISIQIRKSI